MKRLALFLLTVTMLSQADIPALSLMLKQNNIQGRPLSGQVVQEPDGTIWVQGEVQIAPGLVREYRVRAGHRDERPVLEGK